MDNRTLGIVLLIVGVLILIGSLLLLSTPASLIGAVIGVILAVVGLIMLLSAEPEDTAAETKTEPAPAVERTPEPAAPAAQEDLTKIEGIGPKVQSILYEAGISSYAALAAKTSAEISEAVKGGGFKAPFSAESWPQQADLAAKGEWAALEELQDELSGGRA